MDDIVFAPAPGWPPPPSGWTPEAGWQPDPVWPAAPAGWAFYRTSAGTAVPPPPGAWQPPISPAPSSGISAPMDPYATSAGPVLSAPLDPYAARAAGAIPPAGVGTFLPPPAGVVPPVTRPVAKRRSPVAAIIAWVVIIAVAGGSALAGYLGNRYTSPLTQAQFLNAINTQMTSRGFTKPQFESKVGMVSFFECTDYDALGQADLLSAGVYPGAMPGDPGDLVLANFSERKDAEDAAGKMESCLTELGLSEVTSTVTTMKGVKVWVVTGTADGITDTIDVAVFHNILAVAIAPDQGQWTTFANSTFPAVVNAAKKS